jgi:hypothetical protein
LACQTYSYPISDLSFDNYRIEVNSLVSGQLRIQLYAGTEPTPLQNLMGFDLEFAIDAEVPATASAIYNSSNAWTTDEGLFTADISLDPGTHAVSLSFRRTACNSVSGHGLIGEIVLDGLNEPLDHEDLVRLTAGIVLEEIVNGARVAPSGGITDMTDEDGLLPAPSAFSDAYESANFEIKAWPQPAGNHLHVQLPQGHSTNLSLYDQQGRVVLQGHNFSSATNDLDLSGLPGGTYYLRSRSADGSELSRRICKY